MRSFRMVAGVFLSLFFFGPVAHAQDAVSEPVDPWTNSLGAGLAMTSGNTDTLNINLAFSSAFDPKTFHTFKAEVLYLRSESNDEKTADKTSAGARYERKVNPRLFWFGETTYLHDPFKAITHLISPIAGVGYELWSSETMKLGVDGGAGMTFESNEILGDSSSGALKAGQSYEWTISKVSSITQRLNGLWKTDDFDDALYHFDAGITTTIAAAAELKLSYVYDYKNLTPPGVKKGDSALFATVLYKF